MESTHYIMALADREPGQIFSSASLGRAKRYATVRLMDAAGSGQTIALRELTRDADGNFISPGRHPAFR